MWANMTAKNKMYVYIIAAIVIAITGYFVYQYFHPAQTVTGESQQQAETTQGISLAAHNAKVGLVQDQLAQASTQIALLKNQKPDTIIKVVPVEVIKTVEVERVIRGADFAIVTDPKNPTKQVDLKEVAALPADTDVTLNQYNVFAYKKILRDITVYPSFTGITPSGISEVDIGISRKITNSGVYLGVVGSYDLEGRKIKAGLKVTF